MQFTAESFNGTLNNYGKLYYTKHYSTVRDRTSLEYEFNLGISQSTYE